MGARVVKPVRKYHAIRIIDNRKDGELLIVGRSKRGTYLWVGPPEGVPGPGAVYTFSGTATLRKLAQTILEIVGDEP